ncbi:glycoside hydrolase family 3 protein [Mariniluteicoccus flavus]
MPEPTPIPSVLWPGFTGTTVPGWLADELEAGLAGVVLFAGNIASPAQLTELCAEIRTHRSDALIGIDEEGGTVTRLESDGGSTVPSAAALGHLDDVATTRAVGRELARRCLEVGANVVLAPVADVNTNPANPVIGIRSFGSNPDLVSRHVAAAVEGMVGTGAACCPKHFPGHGDTTADSHHDLPVSGATEVTQRTVHLPPFIAAIRAGAQMVMSAHVVVPHLGPEPATCNPSALALLRDTGFDGVICSDALEMKAIADTLGIGGGAAAALAAGVDLLCLGNPAPGADREQYAEAYAGVSAALADGRLAPTRLQEAAGRVRRLGAEVRVGDHRPGDAVVDLAAISARALSGGFAPLSGTVTVVDLRHRVNMAAGAVDDRFTAELVRAGLDCAYARLRPGDPLPDATGTVLALTDDLAPGGWQQTVRTALGDPPTIHAGLAVDLPQVLCTRDASLSAARAAAASAVGRR